MSNHDISRRALLLGGLAFTVSGCMSTLQGAVEPIRSAASMHPPVDPRFKKTHVQYQSGEEPGTLVIDTRERFLYAVEGDGWAMRYGVAVGEENLTFKGTATIGRKADWPAWMPTADMIQRKPHLAQYAGGVPGGPNNPLGARALYLYQGGNDTMFRLHGTNEPWLIGTAVSNGCIRLTNENIIELYDRTPLGTKVIVI
jgi:lipoprotein-anchoring transpeptidase ErfK/SrfK